MAEYQFRLKAQPWRTDPYYVSSSQPVTMVEVVATTEQEAFAEARLVLSPLNRSYYWRLWAVESKDIRLLEPARTDVAP